MQCAADPRHVAPKSIRPGRLNRHRPETHAREGRGFGRQRRKGVNGCTVKEKSAGFGTPLTTVCGLLFGCRPPDVSRGVGAVIFDSIERHAGRSRSQVLPNVVSKRFVLTPLVADEDASISVIPGVSFAVAGAAPVHVLPSSVEFRPGFAVRLTSGAVRLGHSRSSARAAGRCRVSTKRGPRADLDRAAVAAALPRGKHPRPGSRSRLHCQGSKAFSGHVYNRAWHRALNSGEVYHLGVIEKLRLGLPFSAGIRTEKHRSSPAGSAI